MYTKQNSQKSYIRGTELSFNYRITNALSVKTNASYLYGQNISGKEPMRRIPPFNGRVLLNYSKEKWGLGTEYLFAGKQGRLAKGDKDDNRIPLGGTPGWNLLNLYGNYTINQLSFYVAVQNVFNEDYRTHGSGINGMGRSASLTMEINL